jgi:hypothetical protein
MKNDLLSSGRIIDQQASLKAFPMADILSLASGLLLPASGARQVHQLVYFLTGKSTDAAALARDAKECVEEQLPFLKAIDYTMLHNAFRGGRVDDSLQIWFEAQVQKYGAEHHIMPRARWTRRKNSHKL